MTPEEKSLLERTYKLAEDNNSLLRSMRRSTRITNIMRFVYWGVIILLSLGAFYFIQPYVNSLMSVFGSGTGGPSQSESSLELLQSLLK